MGDSSDPKVLAYRVDQLEKSLEKEIELRRQGDDKNAEEMGKVRVALYALSGTTIGSCLLILIGQLLINHPSS